MEDKTPQCLVHTKQIADIETKIDALIQSDVVTVINGTARTIPVKDAVAEIWQKQYEMHKSLTEINVRTEILKDIADLISSIKRITKWVPSIKTTITIGVILFCLWALVSGQTHLIVQIIQKVL